MTASLGLGGYLPLGEQVDLFYTVGYFHQEWDAGNQLEQDIGHIAASIGIRWSPIDWLEFNPKVTHYFPVSDDDFLEAVQSTNLEARIYITASEMFQPFVGVTYNIQEDSDSLIGNLELFQAGVRLSF